MVHQVQVEIPHIRGTMFSMDHVETSKSDQHMFMGKHPIICTKQENREQLVSVVPRCNNAH